MHTRVLRVWKGIEATFILKLRDTTFQQLMRRYNQAFREKRHKQHIWGIHKVKHFVGYRGLKDGFRVCPFVFHLMTRSREVNTCPGWLRKALTVKGLETKFIIFSFLLHPAASNLLCLVLFSFRLLCLFCLFFKGYLMKDKCDIAPIQKKFLPIRGVLYIEHPSPSQGI